MQMRAVFADDAGALQFRKVAAPVARADEVRIRIAATGVNRADLLQRRGFYPPPPGVTEVLGLECSGVIESLGTNVNNLEWSVGDRVCALVPGGAYAEYCCVPASQLLPVADGVDLRSAAAVPEAVATAWRNLFLIGKLAADELLYVNAGASGVGTAAIQLAVAHGTRVACSAGSAEKLARCTALGAELAINYRQEDVFAELRKWTGPSGLHCVLDMLGGEQFSECVNALGEDGRLVLIGLLSGRQSQINLAQVLRKSIRISASTLRGASEEVKSSLAASLRAEFLPLWRSGAFSAQVDSVYKLEQADAAHQHMHAGRNIGKIVLDVN